MRAFLQILLILCVLLRVSAAQAETLVDHITQQLRAQGYDRIETEGTLLGRTRIEARSPAWDREIIVNPRTGEILRDYAERRTSGSGKSNDKTRPDLLNTDDDDDDAKDRDRSDDGDDKNDRADDGDKDSDSDGDKDSDNDGDNDGDSDSDGDSGGDGEGGDD